MLDKKQRQQTRRRPLSLSRDQLVERRARAFALLGKGMPVAEVAREVGCARGTVYRWLAASPGRHLPPAVGQRGRPARLSEVWRARLLNELRTSTPRRRGLAEEDRWSTESVRAYLNRNRGGGFDAGGVGAFSRYLRRLGLRWVRGERGAAGTSGRGYWIAPAKPEVAAVPVAKAPTGKARRLRERESAQQLAELEEDEALGL